MAMPIFCVHIWADCQAGGGWLLAEFHAISSVGVHELQLWARDGLAICSFEHSTCWGYSDP